MKFTNDTEVTMNATIVRQITFRGGRKFVKGERVTALDHSSLFLSWLNEYENTITVEADGIRYSMPLSKIKLDPMVELPVRYQRA